MDIRQLHYFLTAAEEGNITRAAEKMNMSQPPLSQQLLLLEKELGCRLFERSPRGVTLTAAGKALRKRAEQILDLVALTGTEMQDMEKGLAGRISVATISSFGYAILPNLIARFRRTFPAVTFDLRHAGTADIFEMLRLGMADIGIVRYPINEDMYDFIRLPADEFVAAAPKGFFEDGEITLKRLSWEPLLVHERQAAMIEETFEQNGLAPRVYCRSDDSFPLLYWAAAGLGVAIVHESVGTSFPGNLDFYKIKDFAPAPAGAVIHLKRRKLTPAAARFYEMFHV